MKMHLDEPLGAKCPGCDTELDDLMHADLRGCTGNATHIKTLKTEKFTETASLPPMRSRTTHRG